MRKEFEYWYPMDLRCSGKDLIGNHLTMSLYNHAAIWEDQKKMPRGIFCNGWMLLNDLPMSKSKGNFITLSDCVDKYSADASRMTLADSGDTLTDGNFKEINANATILKLFNLGQWIESELKKIDFSQVDLSNLLGTFDQHDAWFDNEINSLITSTFGLMKEMKFKIALRDGFHQLMNVRDDHISLKGGHLNPALVLRYIEVQL